MLDQAVKEALEQLSPREQEVVRLRFGLDDGKIRTLEEVGKEFGVTRERVRQIESKTLAKLRRPTPPSCCATTSKRPERRRFARSGRGGGPGWCCYRLTSRRVLPG